MRRYVALAVTAMVCLGSLGLAAEADAAKEKFQRTKPHVNVSGPLTVTSEIVRLSVAIVQPTVLGGLESAFTSDCSGTVNLRIIDASTSDATVLAERLDVDLRVGAAETLEYATGDGVEESVYAVIATNGMDVDGKSCVVRSTMEVLSGDRAEVRVEKFHVRQEYGPVRPQ